MSVLERLPAPIRKAASAVFPTRWVEAGRRAALRPYDLRSVVVRESNARTWFNRHILRLYYPASMVSRQSGAGRWASRNVAKELPLLHHFDIHLTDHCNLNCKGCGHYSSLCKPFFLDLEVFERDMSAVAKRLRVTQVYLLGGEPLLHPRLPEFILAARKYLPETRLYVVTNGVLVTKQPEEFWQALAETGTILQCDSYPIGLPVAEIDALGAKYGVTVEWTDPRAEFFKVPLDLDGAQDPTDAFKRCSGINNCPIIKDGRIYPCAVIAYADAFKDRFGVESLEVSDADSISILDDRDPQEILDFLLRPVPYCRYCDWDAFEMFQWGRTERSIDEWV